MSTPLPGPSGSRSRPVAGARLRRPRPAALVAAGFLLVPVLELAVAIMVGQAIGVLPTLLLLLASSVAGVVLLRRMGASAVRRLATPAGPRTVAGRPPADGAARVLAGVLLLVPGFLTGVAGLVLLLPPVRRLLVARAGVALTRRVQRLDLRGVRLVGGQVFPGQGFPGQVIPGEVIPGEVIPGEVIPGAADPVRVEIVEVRDLDPRRPPGG